MNHRFTRDWLPTVDYFDPTNRPHLFLFVGIRGVIADPTKCRSCIGDRDRGSYDGLTEEWERPLGETVHVKLHVLDRITDWQRAGEDRERVAEMAKRCA